MTISFGLTFRRRGGSGPRIAVDDNRCAVAGRPTRCRCAMPTLLIGYARCLTDQQDLTA